jgi:sporulation protein YlmC with PRC-barrel domain
MNQKFRKTLISAAVAALLSSPAWAGTHAPQNTSDAARTQSGQLNDAPSKMGTTPEQDAGSPNGISRSDMDRSMNSDARTGARSGDGASRAGVSDNPLYSRTPEDVNGMEVIGANGEDIGKIKHVVLGSDRQNVYAVIASGGFLGLGKREFLVPLDELKVVGDTKVQLSFTKDAIESRPEYDSAQYRELESNRAISEFSAFEPTSGEPPRVSRRLVGLSQAAIAA